MHKFRYLETGSNPAAFNMGLDEALLDSVAAGGTPTLRLYAWEPAAVSLGYFQGLADEVDREACKRHGVDVVRRITGGGAVFHQDELTYSIVVPESHPLAQGSILDTYRTLCSGIIEGFQLLGIEAQFSPINDVVSGGKKLSGNAQTRKRGCLLQHGTVLLGVDVDTMFELLKVPSEKLRGKLIQDVKARVSSVALALGRRVSYGESVPAFRDGFAAALGLELETSAPTEGELALAARLAAERFASGEWTAKR